MTEGKPHYLFVYGTLKRGGRLFGNLEDVKAEFVCEGKIHGRLYDVGWYPGAKPSDDLREWVHGEVFLVRDDAALEQLDRVEGVGVGLFGRYRVPVWTPDDKKLDVRTWVWFYGRDVDEKHRIASGVFPLEAPSERPNEVSEL